jgi:magnesium-transporting ATPase (P-type)
VIYVKGAPDRLFPLCCSQFADDELSTITASSGNTVPLQENAWLTAQEQLSSQGLRVLALCRCAQERVDPATCLSPVAAVWISGSSRPPACLPAACLVPAVPHPRGEVGPHEDVHTINPASLLARKEKPFLTLVALLAILDPPRDEAIEAVKVAHKAGIVVKMITGTVFVNRAVCCVLSGSFLLQLWQRPAR